jgi:peptide/nickel transport system ATP-binding protein
MVFQDPYSSLNPRMRIGDAIMEPMLVHGLQPDVFARRKKALELLNKVGLTRDHFNRFPNEFSGGQRQRICIARALASEPGFIIFDESVSSLDVSAQAVILNLINELKSELGFTCLFISHDLSVVKYMSDRIVVMNQGKIEELAEADALYENPKSAYTQSLIASIPLGRPQDIDRAIELRKI